MIRLFIVALVLLFSVCNAAADPLILAAGAGYKRVMSEIIEAYEKNGGQRVDQIYGNMGHILIQAKGGANIALIIGERGFLESSETKFASFHDIGQGVLVIAYSKAVRIKAPEDLLKPEITRVAIPDEKHAIYGKAGMQFLHNTKLRDKLREKLLVVSTVPQVSAYLMSGDAEAGFINLTDALYVKDRIGGYLVLDKALYHPIKLVVGVVEGYEERPETKSFLEFVTRSPEVKEISRKAGL